MLKMTSGNKKPIFKHLLGFSGGLLILAACSPIVEEAQEEVVRPAKLIEILSTSNVQTLRSPAVIQASQSSDLTFQVGGEITSLSVVEGQEVRKGAVIARLNQRAYRNEVSQAKTAFDAAKIEFDRAERLLAGNAIARSVFEQRESQLDVARAQLDTANKAIEDTILRSPFSGVIATKHAKKFQNIQPLEKIVTLQTTGAAEAEVQIPSSLIAQSGRFSFTDTSVLLDSAPDQKIPATFLSIGTQADPATRTYTVKYGFTPPEGLTILPGMTATVQVTATIQDDNKSIEQIRIPLGAILSEGDAQFIWVVDKETMTVSRREISLGPDIGDELVVESGLQAGETIVGAGASYLHEGQKIRQFEG